MSVQVPNGLDRADGLLHATPPDGVMDSPIGTPTPADALLVTDASGTDVISFQEEPDSPVIERAEQGTVEHRFKTTWDDALTRISGLGRGTILYDSYGTETRILSSVAQHLPCEAAMLKVIAEGLSFDTPPDEFSITPVDLGLNIIKNPRYFYNLYPTDGTDPNYPNNDYTPGTVTLSDGSTCSVALIKQSIIRSIQTYQDNPFFPSVNMINSAIQNAIISSLVSGTIAITNNSNATFNYITASQTAPVTASINLALAAAGEIVQKLWNQEDNPPLSGYKISWKQYYFKDPALGESEPLLFLNPGSYIEDPIYQASPALPDYFGSTCGNYAIDTIFDSLALFNPQAYSLNGDAGSNPPPIYGSPDSLVSISWLRQADSVDYQRTWFCVERSWIGSPIGHWDKQIFNNGSRPSLTSDYLPLAT